MKYIIIALITASFSSMASAQGCFTLDTDAASEASKVCFSSTEAKVYTREDFLLETINLTNTTSYANLGHGVVWKFVVSMGEGKSFAVKATDNSGGGFSLNYVKDLKTGVISREYKPVPYTRPRNTCNGRGRCI